jgi:hypothetical protein
VEEGVSNHMVANTQTKASIDSSSDDGDSGDEEKSVLQVQWGMKEMEKEADEKDKEKDMEKKNRRIVEMRL